MQKINYARLRYQLEFGHCETHENQNGILVQDKWVVDKTVWGAIYTNSIDQTYKLMGEHMTDTRSFIIRHNPELEHYQMIKFRDKIYDCLQFTIDPNNDHNSFDVVTGKEWTIRGQ